MAMHVGEAATDVKSSDKQSAKLLHGSEPHSGFGQGHGANVNLQKIKKRSLRRAIKRLDRCGHTWYKGQLWTQNIHTPTFVDTTPQPTNVQTLKHEQPHEHIPRGRLQCFHWNAGALSSHKYRELLVWLEMSKVDIAIITETHWTLVEEWNTMHFHAIHSGNGTPEPFDRSAGILILISKRLCEASQISWASQYAGRLIHCRLHCHPRNIDIVGVYQYVWNGNVLQTQRRKNIWDHIQKTVDSLAKRNILCLMGDFNCSLSTIPRLVGCNHYVDSTGQKMQGPHHGDCSRFQMVISELKLVGLNTWHPWKGPTFMNTLGRSSRIDFIFTRMLQADAQAKDVGHLCNAPFLSGGPQHIPLLASLGRKVQRPQRSSQLTFTSKVKQQCIDDFRADSVQWQECMNNINYTLRHTEEIDLQALTDKVNAGILHAYDRKSSSDSSGGTLVLRMKWNHFRQARTPANITPSQILQKWFHYTRFLKLDKIHQQQVRMNQRRRIQDMMNEGNLAFEKHDAYQLFKILNKNCPKQRLKRIRLKSSTGQFLSPVEETAEYCRYIAEAWSGPAMKIPILPAPGIPFTVGELEHALEGLPSTRAVAPPYAPGSAWKCQAHFIAPWLMTQRENWWNTSPPYIPQGWKDGWMVFLPKPNKASTKVENLRVLALQDPVGKCIVKLLTQKALRACLPQICHNPQFAYLPFRSTREALMRVADHCDAVRQLL